MTISMKRPFQMRVLGTGVLAAVLLGACSQAAPPQSGPAPAAPAEAAPTAPSSTDPRLNPTAAVGGGINASNAISADDVISVFKSLPQASQLKMTANSSPPGARGGEVQSVSVSCQDTGGLLKSLDATGKRSLGEAMLTAAGAAWPNASVSLLVSDPSGAGGQIIGIRAAGGANTVIVS
jgi:hypothetical protein